MTINSYPDYRVYGQTVPSRTSVAELVPAVERGRCVGAIRRGGRVGGHGGRVRGRGRRGARAGDGAWGRGRASTGDEVVALLMRRRRAAHSRPRPAPPPPTRSRCWRTWAWRPWTLARPVRPAARAFAHPLARTHRPTPPPPPTLTSRFSHSKHVCMLRSIRMVVALCWKVTGVTRCTCGAGPLFEGRDEEVREAAAAAAAAAGGGGAVPAAAALRRTEQTG
ncbi:Protein of unknown function, partial [Gryllus bimaculatus]